MPTPVLRLPLMLLLLTTLVAGCAYTEIEQGNYLTQSQVAKLDKGMERAKVRRLLGEPLIQDPFHPDRWDYVYMRISKEGAETRRRLTLFFDDRGRVSRIVKEGAPYPEAYSPEDS